MPTPIEILSYSSSGAGADVVFDFDDFIDLQDGDLLVAFLAQGGQVNGAAPWWATQAGWTLRDDNENTSGDDRFTSIQYKFASSESGTITFSLSTTPGTFSSRACHLVNFRDVDPTTPFDIATDSWSTGSNNNQPNPPSVTTITDDALVVCFPLVTNNDITGWVPSTGYTLLGSVGSSYGQSAVQHKTVPTAGLEDPDQMANTDNGNSVAEQLTYTTALRPAAASDINIVASLSEAGDSVSAAVEVRVGISAAISEAGDTSAATVEVLNLIVQCTLVDRNGNALLNQTTISWAWFDEPDPVDFTSPTDQGEAETTDGSGLLYIEIPNSTVGAGNPGTLILRSNDGTLIGCYNLSVEQL